ncbi:MAG: phosphatidylglycerol lysyltransferase domain-containing protein [bacterium]
MTFTNLFGWRKVCGYRLSRFQGGLLLLKQSNGIDTFLPPQGVSNPLEAVEACFGFLRAGKKTPVLERVGEDLLLQAPVIRERFEVLEDQDNDDYVYEVQQLVDLKGKKFHDKRNRLNQFRKNYAYRYLPLTQELVEACLTFEHEWCEEKNCDEDEGLYHEKCAVLEMLRNFENLSAGGGLIEIDGVVVALTLGEVLNEDTFVIHVEKAKGSLEGIYQAIHWEFLRREAISCRFVNREQDLGIEGLRRSKESYNPVRKIKKYTLKEKQDK